MKNETAESKKRWFGKYRRLLQVEDRLNDKLAELDHRILSIRSPNYSSISSRGGSPITIADLLSDKELLEERIKRIHIRVVKCKNEILDVIDSIEDPTLAHILEAHYIYLESMDEIALYLNYTTRHVFRLFTKAIDLVIIPSL